MGCSTTLQPLLLMIIFLLTYFVDSGWDFKFIEWGGGAVFLIGHPWYLLAPFPHFLLGSHFISDPIKYTHKGFFADISHALPVINFIFLDWSLIIVSHEGVGIVGRFPFTLTLTMFWINTKVKDSPGISPGISLGICLLWSPRVIHLPLICQKGNVTPIYFWGNLTLNYFKKIP